jgi:hypothetical protein
MSTIVETAERLSLKNIALLKVEYPDNVVFRFRGLSTKSSPINFNIVDWVFLICFLLGFRSENFSH